MKFILSLLVLFSCSLLAAVNPHFDEAMGSTFYVGVGQGHGTGVQINPKCVVTANHVVADPKEQIKLIDPTGKIVPASIAASDPVADLAVVCAAQKLSGHSARISESMPKRYAPIFSLGFPLQNAQILTEGRYQENSTVTADIAPGNSGGGVFDEETGQLIGLSQAIDEYASTEGNFVFPYLQTIIESPTIISFLNSHQIEHQ